MNKQQVLSSAKLLAIGLFSPPGIWVTTTIGLVVYAHFYPSPGILIMAVVSGAAYFMSVIGWEITKVVTAINQRNKLATVEIQLLNRLVTASLDRNKLVTEQTRELENIQISVAGGLGDMDKMIRQVIEESK
jgi:hypothetical protein